MLSYFCLLPARSKQLDFIRQLHTDESPRHVGKSRLELPHAVYDITEPEDVQTFWEEFRKVWNVGIVVVEKEKPDPAVDKTLDKMLEDKTLYDMDVDMLVSEYEEQEQQ